METVIAKVMAHLFYIRNRTLFHTVHRDDAHSRDWVFVISPLATI